MRLLRGLSGVAAAGTVLLTLVVVGAAVLGGQRGFPGPGAESVTWHLVASAVVLAAQIFADRRRGSAAFSGCAVVFLVTGTLLWTQWWG
ncbi:hypothetical protein IU433_10265 [Nocardia puris]|uniref:Uncharacterized protein n=1 Tax=Nocardia puris TaxID=208602 RepID=A0A366DR98_9NOCA|nr:hypothetical protein [Nocardia puris]MBF6210896.1 hypothetical protein [Nocardia puris]MBF6364491.1 hypothetical protein [Nocardia puris]MBF6459420.1 hypothetical protein [Nocardia puris]RBO92620.1 hypothetical protein DFR74_103264 [Nocardia puris]